MEAGPEGEPQQLTSATPRCGRCGLGENCFSHGTIGGPPAAALAQPGLGKSLLEIGQEMKERQQGVVLEKRREHRFEFGAEMTRIPTPGEKTQPGDQEQK